MNEFEVVSKVISRLKENSEFMALLDTFNGYPMLIQAMALPETWGLDSSSVNIYTLFNASNLEYSQYYFTASCRGKDYQTSRTIALKMIEELNRSNIEEMFVVAECQATIPPSDVALDNYNTPVEILVRNRG